MPAPDLSPAVRAAFDPDLLLPGGRTSVGLLSAWRSSTKTTAHLLAHSILKDTHYLPLWDRLRAPGAAQVTREGALDALIAAGLIAEVHDPAEGLWPEGRPRLPWLASGEREHPTCDATEDRVVVVLPGVFDPFHAGHANALTSAYRALTARGVRVAACVAAPCHDNYASHKRADWTPAVERIASIARVSVDVPRLLVSQSETAAVCPLNFTTVLDTIAADTGLRPVMVFGADNAGFAHAFTSAEDWVCITRPGHEHAVPAGVTAVGEGIEESSTHLRALAAAATATVAAGIG
jgi:nicotinic acid mononucleotide adenylyltransferase